MEKRLKTLGIEFGRKHIATNGNFYRVAKPTEAFWTWYKENKEEFKQNGYSVYKHNIYGFCVYDWTFTEKATKEERVTYNKEKTEFEKIQIRGAVQDLRGLVEERSNFTVANCESWEQLENEIAYHFKNPDYIWKEYIVPNMDSFYWS